MAANLQDHLPHLFPKDTAATEDFISPSRGGRSPSVPPRNRQQHSTQLLQKLDVLKGLEKERAAQYAQAHLPGGMGLQVAFASFPEIELVAESLARDRSGIELMAVTRQDQNTVATVWVPEGKLAHFERLLADYVGEKRDKNDRPRDNRALIDSISDIRAATFNSIWTDSLEVRPQSVQDAIWWEVWLPVHDSRLNTLDRFRALAIHAGLDVSPDHLEFPERTVLLIRGSEQQISASGLVLNSIAELRRAKDAAHFFDSSPLPEQAGWVDSLKGRTQLPPEGSPFVCILDTGVSRGHVLLSDALAEEDMHKIDPAWLDADETGHGTEMAGLALYGELEDLLAGDMPVSLTHRLESVKLLRHSGDNEGKHYGHVTLEACARSELAAPDRTRVFSMAVTSQDGRDRGRPSAWSAAIDRLACDSVNEGANPRLFCISAGNNRNEGAWLDYPSSLATDAIHDPGQSWNALTVGAYTQRCQITEPDAANYQPIAAAGSISPFSTTSVSWGRQWPWKPDVVLEGGNAGKDGAFASTFASLSLIAPHYRPLERLLTTSNATSAATALVSNMAARILGVYPALWPETVRALICHAARWTAKMQEEFFIGETQSHRTTNLLRHCGYGVPNLERAMWSASNSLTLIVEDALQPFQKIAGSVRTRDMHLHSLPWPKEALLELGNTDVKLRVALSYFVEPNPGERGFGSKYAYQSHALRFEVRRPLESTLQFRQRVNRLARDEEEGTYTGGGDNGWNIGDRLRRRGSLHLDVWEGTAAELANRGQIAIYPSMGWWRSRTKLDRYEMQARYSLVVSIEAPEIEQDIYSTVADIAGMVPVAIGI